MKAEWFNYALLAQFAAASLVHLIQGNKAQAVYWLGAFLCNVVVTFN
jgi:hypothetical protein